MASLATYDYEQTRDELARAIRIRRSDCSPHELARLLLKYDRPGNTILVGINDDATRAVLYHERDRYALGVQIEARGLADGGHRIHEFGPGFDEWVSKTMSAYWGWLHPRFR